MAANSSQQHRNRCRWLSGYVTVCLIVDLWPRIGAPDFRYTGSDPEWYVWNIGWPLALAIYHPGLGFFPGPGIIPIIVLQALGLGFGVLVCRIVLKLRPSSRRSKRLPGGT
jgi:hypothetical protein